MRPAILLLVFAALIAGCGTSGSSDSSGDFDGQERVVAVAIEDLEEAGREDEPDTICEDLLAASLLERLEQAQTRCLTAVSEALDDADDFDLDVEEISISGTRAQARVVAGDGDDEETDVLRLERDGQEWKIASLGGE